MELETERDVAAKREGGRKKGECESDRKKGSEREGDTEGQPEKDRKREMRRGGLNRKMNKGAARGNDQGQAEKRRRRRSMVKDNRGGCGGGVKRGPLGWARWGGGVRGEQVEG